jgi:hypothetical protein
VREDGILRFVLIKPTREDPSLFTGWALFGAGVEESICLNPLYKLRAVAFSGIKRNLLGV